MTAADPGADTTTQLAELLRPLGEPWPAAPSPETVAAALLPAVDHIVIRALLPIREAHDWQCDCDPDDPCRVRTALTAAFRAEP